VIVRHDSDNGASAIAIALAFLSGAAAGAGGFALTRWSRGRAPSSDDDAPDD